MLLTVNNLELYPVGYDNLMSICYKTEYTNVFVDLLKRNSFEIIIMNFINTYPQIQIKQLIRSS